MQSRNSLFVLIAASLMAAGPARAQQDNPDKTQDSGSTAPGTGSAAAAEATTQPPIEVQHLRPVDQRGLLMFEAPKNDGVPYGGFKLSWGAAFTQQYQALDHSTDAAPRMVNGINANQLMDIGSGFNNATANLYLNAQLAPGIRVALTSYLSSRRHNETWVKDGYLLIDESPLKIQPLEELMKYVTLRVGHFEVNYGDAHFRRTDNGNAIYNPFVGNLILDAFTTEIGGEAYVRANGFMAMAGITGGEIRGNVTRPAERAPAWLGKLGMDKQLTPDLRVRLTGSLFSQKRAINNTLYAGDRAGSRYYFVLENTAATESAQPSSGIVNPGFRSKAHSVMFNPFVKFHGLELFGVLERAKGRAATEPQDRKIDQVAAEAVYRFLPREAVYLGTRYNRVKGELAGLASEISVNRAQFGGGWFITPGILAKAEYVTQRYNDFPTTDIRSGGRFNGFVVEGVVAF